MSRIYYRKSSFSSFFSFAYSLCFIFFISESLDQLLLSFYFVTQPNVLDPRKILNPLLVVDASIGLVGDPRDSPTTSPFFQSNQPFFYFNVQLIYHDVLRILRTFKCCVFNFFKWFLHSIRVLFVTSSLSLCNSSCYSYYTLLQTTSATSWTFCFSFLLPPVNPLCPPLFSSITSFLTCDFSDAAITFRYSLFNLRRFQ